MITRTVYIFSPISGYCTGHDYYCLGYDFKPTPTPLPPPLPTPTRRPTEICSGQGGAHSKCLNWYCPSDIAGAGSTDVYLRIKSTVKSIRTWIGLLCCKSSKFDHCSDDFRRAIWVELFGRVNGGCYIGSVAFVHIAAPLYVGNGVLYNLSDTKKKLGKTTPAGEVCVAEDGTLCSSGPHIHMEMLTGADSYYIEDVRPCCNSTAYASTPIYKLYWKDPSPNPCPTK